MITKIAILLLLLALSTSLFFSGHFWKSFKLERPSEGEAIVAADHDFLHFWYLTYYADVPNVLSTGKAVYWQENLEDD